jgi:Tripartite tricarboxylate transporter family receptor
MRRYAATAFWLAALAFLASVAPPAPAQSYPARPMRFLVGGPPGSGADLVSRMLAPKLSERLGQPVVVEQKTGAGGIIANEALAKSPPDGHTLALLTGAHPTAAAMRRSLPYDPVRDFAMVGTVVAYPLVVSVVPASPIGTFPDLLARAKAAPGKISYAMSPGSLVHLAGEWINSEAGTSMLAVPYRGSSAALVDALGGRVDVMIETATAAFPASPGREDPAARSVIDGPPSRPPRRADDRRDPAGGRIHLMARPRCCARHAAGGYRSPQCGAESYPRASRCAPTHRRPGRPADAVLTRRDARARRARDRPLEAAGRTQGNRAAGLARSYKLQATSYKLQATSYKP